MRITEAAQRLGTSPRMLRYRDMLGLLPPVRGTRPPPRRAAPAGPSAQGAAPTGPSAPGLVPAGPSAQGAAPTGPSAPGLVPAGPPVTGLVSAGPSVRGPFPAATPATASAPSGRPRAHRRFGDDELAAVAHALRIEQRYDISPAALAFGLKVLTEPGVRADVAELGRRIGRITPPPARALDFEQERALRLLRLPPGRAPSGRGPGNPPRAGRH